MRLALAQLAIEEASPRTNTERALDAVEAAADRGADLLALPELWNVGYFAFEAYAREAEPLTGPTLSELADAAADRDLALLAGSVVEDLAASAEAGLATPADEGLANTAVLFDADGDRRAVYRKHHLFGYESAEVRLLTPGEALPVVEVAGFDVGVTTCYDLRFPEQFRALTDRGATLLLVPSAWPYPRVEHWRTLARARAIENLTYLGAVNGTGAFDDAELLGRSAVYDPWGTTLASAGDEPALVTADLDPARVEEVREEFPALADRRE
ncbi:carbon-nitrogen family hydrolase [Candidatus Halobonum tyrrellensis]|uniref:Nitrilase n=1 Tax=Candidatus Halobonum tyrrellensis G22 TaxID=1324957 RepID=V4HCT8_9EURY|nr:carbon-nitrogen family hydrolase [Candidatus Halobonum tyrrellensis]ESP87858.1 nitrilase [Candidatus Halobonum tyrrellensis G22]